MLLRWVYAPKAGEIQRSCPGSPFSCAVPTLVLLAVSGFTQIGLGCGRPAALRSFVANWGLRLLRCVLQGLLHVANQFVGFVVAAFGQDRIKNAGEVCRIAR